MKTIKETLCIVGQGIVLALLLQGCSTCNVSIRDGDDSNERHVLGIRYGSQIIKAIPQPDQPNTAVLHDVKVEDNWFFNLVGVLTLGFAKPSQISYAHIKPWADTGGAPKTPMRAGTEPRQAGVGFGNREIHAVAEPCKRDCISTGMMEVEIKDNLFYDLVGVLSFGLAKPSEVSYYNMKLE